MGEQKFHLFLPVNPLNAELNPICHRLALLGAQHIFHVSGLRVKGHRLVTSEFCLFWIFLRINSY